MLGAAAVGGVDCIKPYGVSFGGRERLDGDRDHPEGDQARPGGGGAHASSVGGRGSPASGKNRSRVRRRELDQRRWSSSAQFRSRSSR